MRIISLLIGLLTLTACGGGGDGGDPPALSGPVSIATASLEQGNVGLVYSQALQATGGNGNFSWWVSASGDNLPSGLTLTPNGQIIGTPTNAAVRSVVLVAQDSSANLATRTLLLETRDISIAGASAGAVALGASLQLSAGGGSASYSFSLSGNTSGGSITPTGSYLAGNGNGVDVVRATDADGFYDEITITVGQDPFVGFIARWGTSDVWHIGWDEVHDPTPTYASDLDEVLVDLGLRDAASTGVSGTSADDLARAFVIRRTLGHVSTFYGNTFDGEPSVNGIAISIVKPSGPTQGTTPAPGDFDAAGTLRYSTICVRYADTGGTVGRAYLDVNNPRVEHNCGGESGGLALGVFVNRLVGPYRSAYGSGVTNNPVGASDVAGLQAMLLGDAPVGAREQAIFNAVDGFARSLAAVLAHEIGHSLGLDHAPAGSSSGDIMRGTLSLGPSISYAFNAQHWAQLETSLPGPNRN